MTVDFTVDPFQDSYNAFISYRQTYGYSPLYNRIPLQPYRATINGTIWPSTDSSVARRFPNPIDEATWDEWETTNMIPITSAEIRGMGKDPTTAAKLEDSIWSLGDDAYAGILDLFHQIHCLNQLRKFAYRDYYDMKIANANPENMTMHEIHTNHCVDILLQALQCSGNLQIATMHWTETQLYPFPDMSIQRQCIDFKAINEWRRKNAISMEKYKNVMRKDRQLKPVEERPIEQGYWDMFKNEPDTFL
ncbi:tat pathway signal sequence [Diaporthe sp. PMI_573]|nr:tat pathway signal sequence [Diaporthaceae sp. PMI_573]